ncbi:MAG: hypothetical protein AB7Q01_08560 [Gammaproteobacteria bacterium]
MSNRMGRPPCKPNCAKVSSGRPPRAPNCPKHEGVGRPRRWPDSVRKDYWLPTDLVARFQAGAVAAGVPLNQFIVNALIEVHNLDGEGEPIAYA